MGTDVIIFVKLREGQAPPSLGDAGDSDDEWGELGDRLLRDRPPGSTHELKTGMRYCSKYGRTDPINFRRWPQIRRVLVQLLNECEVVWYDADSIYEWGGADRMTWEVLAEYDAKYRHDTGGLDPAVDPPEVPRTEDNLRAWRACDPIPNPHPEVPVGAILEFEGFNGWWVVQADGTLVKRSFEREWR